MQNDTAEKLKSLNIHKQEYYSCFYKIHVDNNTASPSPLNVLDWVRIVFDLKSETTYKGIAKWKLCADQIKVPDYVDNDNSERKDLCFPGEQPMRQILLYWKKVSKPSSQCVTVARKWERSHSPNGRMANRKK